MPSPALLELAAHLLLAPLGQPVEATHRRAPGRRIAVAYSGGVDSTAAMRLLEPARAVHTLVDGASSIHRTENALLATARERGLVVLTNSDRLAKRRGRRRGFYGHGAWTIPSVLLADHLRLGVVADGNVLETMYLHSSAGHGTQYNPVSVQAIQDRFAAAGLQYAVPCAGLTEVRTSELAASNPYAMGCLRGQAGEPCRACYKCFRKLALAGQPTPVDPETQGRLDRDLIPMLPSLLWAARHRGLEHPLLQAMTHDVEWTTRWYADSLQFVPEHLHARVRDRVARAGIETLDDDTPIRTWRSSRTPEPAQRTTYSE